MNKSILAITTILALGTVGCAGAGSQYAETATLPRATSLAYASGGLGTLWESDPSGPRPLEQTVAAKDVGSDLWTPASVVRNSEASPEKNDPKRSLARSTVTELKF